MELLPTRHPNTTVTAVWDDGDYGNYYVSVRTSRHGSVLPDVEYASSGSRVTLTVTPDRGYELEEISVTNSRTGRWAIYCTPS